MKTDRPCDGEYSEQLEQLRATEERNTEQLRGTEERNTEPIRGTEKWNTEQFRGNRGKEQRTTYGEPRKGTQNNLGATEERNT